MRLDLSDILREVGKVLPYDIHEPPLVDEDVECTQPIEGRLTFNNTGGTLLVQGNADTRVALPCSLCGVYFEQPVALRIDEQFELRHVSVGPRTLQTFTIVEEDENPTAGKMFDGHVFDLSELLRQYLLLDEPTKPLPPTNVEGQCAHCGLCPDEILQVAGVEEEKEVSINTAFAQLGDLLKEEKN